MAKGYYMAEIATQFFIMGIVAGVIGVIFHLNDMKVNDIAVSFKDGAKDLIGAALVVAMATGHHAGARRFRSDHPDRYSTPLCTASHRPWPVFPVQPQPC